MEGKKLGKICLASILFLLPTYASESTPEPELIIEPWEKVSSDRSWLDRVIGETAEGVADAIFEALEDLRLFKLDLGDSGDVRMNIGRKVYDNRDVRGTWTVIDKMRVKGQIPVLERDVGLGGGAALGFQIGTQAGIEFINIRQVRPPDYESLPKLDEQIKQIQSTRWYREVVEGRIKENGDFQASVQPDHGRWVYDVDDRGKEMLSFLPMPEDPDTRSRLGRFWNLVTFPFKFPIKSDAIRKMDDHEIISFAGEGGISLGASVGWSLDPTTILDLARARIGITTYLKGTYRISVRRESERFAHVKVTRAFEAGTGGSVGTEIKIVPLTGFFIVDQIVEGANIDFKIVPFNLKVTKSDARMFDIGYRYDLHNPNAVKAYEKAVMGQLKLSSHYSKQGLGVTETFTRKTDTKEGSEAREMRLAFIGKNSSNSSYKNIDTVIQTPDGEDHVFKALVENSKQWKLFWGRHEKFRYKFAINVNLDQFKENPECEACLNLIAEGEIEDSAATRKELMNYILEVENSVGRFGIFPRPPRKNMRLLSHRPNTLPFAHFGDADFYYQVGIKNLQVKRFMDVDDEMTKWRLLEQAFRVPEGSWGSGFSRFIWQLFRAPLSIINLPLYVTNYNIRGANDLAQAYRMKRHWDRLKKASSVKRRVERLGRLFFHHLYSYEMITLLRSALTGEEVAYVADGNTDIFGKVTEVGSTELNFEDIASKRQKEIEWDGEGPSIPGGGAESKVYNLDIVQDGLDRMVIKFRLETEPQAAYFQLWLDNDGPWGKKKLAELIVPNQNGQFVQGVNQVEVLRTPENPWFPLIQPISKKNEYKLRVAINPEGVRWGEVRTRRFDTE